MHVGGMCLHMLPVSLALVPCASLTQSSHAPVPFVFLSMLTASKHIRIGLELIQTHNGACLRKRGVELCLGHELPGSTASAGQHSI